MFDTPLKLVLGISIALGLLYWISSQEKSPVKNKGSLPTMNLKVNRSTSGKKNSDLASEVAYNDTGCASGLCASDSCDAGKMTSKTEIDEWDEYFRDTNSVIGRSQISKEEDRFVPRDVTDGRLAPYECSSVYKRSKTKERKDPDGSFDPDMYDPENLLPKEHHDDWFETIDEPVALRNRHLVNLQQGNGINTQGQSLKIATHDIRGNPPCPKAVVSPWNNSTVEPDFNIKPLY